MVQEQSKLVRLAQYRVSIKTQPLNQSLQRTAAGAADGEAVAASRRVFQQIVSRPPAAAAELRRWALPRGHTFHGLSLYCHKVTHAIST